MRRSLEERLGTPVETVDPRAAAALTDRIARGAGAARHAGAARRPAAARARRGARHDPHQPLDAAVLQRARRPPLAAASSRLVVARGDGVQRRRACFATRAATRELATQASRDEARAARSARAGRAAARERRSASRSTSRPPSAAGQRPDRSPHVLVDRALQPLRDDAARRRPDHVGAADASTASAASSLTITVVARSVDDVDEFMENLEATGAFSELLGRVEEHSTSRGCSRSTLEAVYMPTAGGRRRRTGGGADDARCKRILVEKRALDRAARARRCSSTSPCTRSSCIRSASSRPAPPIARPRPRASLQAAERDVAAARALVAGKVARRPGAGDVLRQSAAGRSGRGAAHDLRAAAGAGAQDERHVSWSARFERRTSDREGRAARRGCTSRMVLQGDYETSASSSTSSRPRRSS